MSSGLLVVADVGGAFTGLGGLMVSWLAPILGFVLILAGYHYMFALDDHMNAAKAKRAVGYAIGGAILIAVALLLAPALVTAFGH